MDTETVIDESPKKGRIRRKQLLNTIQNQMHFYFSDANLSKDRFMSEILNNSEYIDLAVFLNFNKIRKMTTSIEEIAKAIKNSDMLELNDDASKVKRKLPLKIKPNIDECIIYVQTLQPDTTHEWLINVFSEFGKVEYVSLPKYSHNKLNKGFAFIEYANTAQVKNALDYFESINCCIPSNFDAEQLCSNMTNTKENIESTTDGVENTNKRKLEDSEESYCKKIKVDVEDTVEETGCDEKKSKKRSNKRKQQIKDCGLQILTKLEWKRMRNRYWDMQRKKMKQLKQHLNKRRLQQSNYLDIKVAKTSKANDDNELPPKHENKDFLPGIIVQLKLTDACSDSKKLKNELTSSYSTIEYVEVPISLTSDIAYLRFSSAESATEFCSSNSIGQAIVLSGTEESQYWEKIQKCREKLRSKDVKKQRGRDKLLKRAERELGKHIRFDDPDE